MPTTDQPSMGTVPFTPETEGPGGCARSVDVSYTAHRPRCMLVFVIAQLTAPALGPEGPGLGASAKKRRGAMVLADRGAMLRGIALVAGRIARRADMLMIGCDEVDVDKVGSQETIADWSPLDDAARIGSLPANQIASQAANR